MEQKDDNKVIRMKKHRDGKKKIHIPIKRILIGIVLCLILAVGAIAAFCPNPRMTVYSAGKSYVSAFTIGLAEELQPKGITATAVCPAPMQTEFLEVGRIAGNSRMFERLPYCDQVQVAGGALRAARAGRTIYTPKLFYKFYRLVAKVTPVKLMVKFTKT